MSDTAEVSARLDHLTIVDAAGADAESFLQGQFCNDMAGLAGAQRTGYCSPKGRLLAVPVLQRLDAGFRLIVPTDLVESFLTRLRMFVMRADVSFDVRADLVCVGVFCDSDPLFASLGVSPPNAPMSLVVAGEASVMCCEDARWLAVVPGSSAADVAQDGSLRWRRADIRGGIPTVVEATREAFVPQMMNLAEVGGLSFTKGCYPGQEIVARTQYLGKLKKHMKRFVASAGELPVAGQTLGEPGTPEAGDVVDAVALEDGSVDLLAVVRIERDAESPLPLSEGHVAVPAELPYEPPSAGDCATT